LYLTVFDNKPGSRAGKGHDRDAMHRLHEKGYLPDPRSKAKSVVMAEEGKKSRSARESYSRSISLPEAGARCQR